jgi:hypothetical protein
VRNPVRVIIPLILAGSLLSACVTDAPRNTASQTGGSGGFCGTSTAWSPEQVSNAQQIVKAAYDSGTGQRGAEIGVTTAITEATLIAVNKGDIMNGSMTTSRGLFQQMDPWGPLADRLDPYKSAMMFYNGGAGGQEGLLDIPNWVTLSIPKAAQAVEKSQFADGSNYARNEQAGVALATAISSVPCTTGGGGTVGQVAGFNPSQDPSSFGWSRGEQNMEPLVWNGKNFGKVAKGTVPIWTSLLNELVPLIPGGLTNDLGCWADRANVNSPGRWSFHAYGLSCDINSGDNPNGVVAIGRTGPHVLPYLAMPGIAAKYGMIWGGNFTGTPDGMHLELHVSPEAVRAATSGAGTPPAP